MASQSALRRFVTPVILTLAVMVVASAPAFAFVPVATDAPAPAPRNGAASSATVATAGSRITSDEVSRSQQTTIAGTRRPDASAIAAEWAAAARQRAQAVRVRPAAVQKASPHGSGQVSYHGRNHVWIPSLGVSRSVAYFSCSDSGVGNYVYRWGCAGRNNVYLFGHASSVFQPLHDAYAHHRLRRGMKVVYADGSGHVRTYRVTFWKVVSPTGGTWAYAAQSRPSLTLQTCVGADSKYRLIVRLVAS
jgi:sortase (surface protein transpeptidase)